MTKTRKFVNKFFMYLVLTLFCIILLFPIANAVVSSFKTNAEINRVALFPSSFSFANYAKVVKTPIVWTGFLNSAIVVLSTMALSVVLASFAGYGIARRTEKRFTAFYFLFLSAMMIPTAANMSALYDLVRKLGLLDTRLGLILIYTAGAMPMGVMLYTGFLKSIPKELDESATIDGCSYMQRFFVVILPLLKPIIVTQIITSCISVWNDFFTPLLLIRSAEKKTISVAIYAFSGENFSDWGAIFALLVLAMIPPVLLFILCQKHFYQGITTGAVKG